MEKEDLSQSMNGKTASRSNSEFVVRSNLLAALLTTIVSIIVLIGVFRMSFWIVGKISGINIPEAINSTVHEVAATFSIAEQHPVLLGIFSSIGKIASEIIGQVIVVVLVVQSFFINKNWTVLEDEIIFRRGYVLTRETRVQYTRLLNVYGTTYSSLMNLGSITVVVLGEEQPFKLNFVVDAEQRARDIAEWMQRRKELVETRKIIDTLEKDDRLLPPIR